MRNHPKGFTLIELMVSVAIVGILSSVALPTFRNFQYRARQAERGTIMKLLQLSIEDYVLLQGRLPEDWGGGSSGLWLNANPDWIPGTSKRPWRVADWGDDWLSRPGFTGLNFKVDGNVYYSYWAQGTMVPGMRWYWVLGVGDLDGDGNQDQIQKLYQYSGVVLQRFGNCQDCTWEWRSNGVF